MSNVSLEKFKPNISVFGVGGAGLNAINDMIFSQLENVNFVGVNTDAQSLASCLAKTKIQIGAKQTKGLGAGADPEIGKISAEENINEIREALKGVNVVFIAMGLGGGTGTGAGPVIAKEAKALGVLTVVVASKPFDFEGEKRMQIANQGLAELEKNVDTLIIMPNDKLVAALDPGKSFIESFKTGHEVLLQITTSVCHILHSTGMINADFADLKTVMSNMGRAMIGYGEVDGQDRQVKMIEMISKNDILEDSSIEGAKKVLISITGNNKMTMSEIQYIVGEIKKKIHPQADIIFGVVFDPNIESLKATVIGTGLSEKRDFFPKKEKSKFDYFNLKDKEKQKNSDVNEEDVFKKEKKFFAIKEEEEKNFEEEFNKVNDSLGEDLDENFTGSFRENAIDGNKFSDKTEGESEDKSEEWREKTEENARKNDYLIYDFLNKNFENSNRRNNLNEKEVLETNSIIPFPKGVEKVNMFRLMRKENFNQINQKGEENSIAQEFLGSIKNRTEEETKIQIKPEIRTDSIKFQVKEELNIPKKPNSSEKQTSNLHNFSDLENEPVVKQEKSSSNSRMPLFEMFYSKIKENTKEFISGPEVEIENKTPIKERNKAV